jgi:hypothetical protein
MNTKMQYNECKYCGAKDGRAGFLVCSPAKNIENACKNCYDTLSSGVVTINTNLNRTSDEINKTINLLNSFHYENN